MHNINLPGNEFEFSIFILFTTIVIDSNPAPHVAFVLLVVQHNRVVSIPVEASRPVRYFARGRL